MELLPGFQPVRYPGAFDVYNIRTGPVDRPNT